MRIVILQNGSISLVGIFRKKLLWCHISHHITRRNAKHTEHHRRSSRKMHTVAFLCVIKKSLHKILAVLQLVRICLIAAVTKKSFYHILANLFILICNCPVRHLCTRLRFSPVILFLRFRTFLLQPFKPFFRNLKIIGTAKIPIRFFRIIQHTGSILTVTIAFQDFFGTASPVAGKNILLPALSAHCPIPVADLIYIIQKSIIWNIRVPRVGIQVFYGDLVHCTLRLPGILS